MSYQYMNSKGVNYYLHSREITLKGSGKVQRIYFFSRELQDGGLEQLPEGFQVVENQRTGLPVLKRT